MSVEFSMNFVFAKDDIQTIVNCCPKLYEIKLPSILMTADAIQPLSQLKSLNSIEFGETNIWNLNISFDLWTLTASDYLGYQIYSANGVDKSDFYWHIPNEKQFSLNLTNCYQKWNQIRKLQINIFKINSKILDCFTHISLTLRNLKLEGIKAVEHRDPLIKFFINRPSLLKLKLEFVNFGERDERLLAEESILNVITYSCLMLRTLEIQYYSKYGPFSKKANFKKLQKIKTLSILQSNFGDSLNFLQTAADLESLTLSGVINDNVDNIWRREWGFTKLTHLEIKIEKTYFTIDNVIEILSMNRKLSKFHLPLIATPTEKEIEQIGQNCFSIEELILPNYYNPFSNQELFEKLIEKIFCSYSRRQLPLLVKTTKNLKIPTRFQGYPIYIKILL